MSLENVRYGRVVQAVVIILGLSLVVYFLTSCLLAPFMSQTMENRLSDLLHSVSDLLNKMGDSKVPKAQVDKQTEQVNQEMKAFAHDYGPQLSANFGAQWAFMLIITFEVARRTARRADTPEQAIGYGLLIGLGVTFSYGLCCVLTITVTYAILRIAFFMLLPVAGYLGGRAARGSLSPAGSAAPSPFPGLSRAGTSPASPYGGTITPGGNPETFYNMGVMAALGGRRDEARQHFTRVLQMQPRHVPAWLQLANLSDTPEQAWNYIQQARSISPNDPAVVQAVSVIWPQVAANAARTDTARQTTPPGVSTEAPTMLDMHTVSPETPAPGAEAPSGSETQTDQQPPVPPPTITPPGESGM